jgi:transglutaminase-like putative cysteine protease
MKLVIDHLTRYGYDEEVKFSTQYLRLTPRSTGRQKITAWTLTLPDGAAVPPPTLGQCAACADAG